MTDDDVKWLQFGCGLVLLILLVIGFLGDPSWRRPFVEATMKFLRWVFGPCFLREHDWHHLTCDRPTGELWGCPGTKFCHRCKAWVGDHICL